MISQTHKGNFCSFTSSFLLNKYQCVVLFWFLSMESVMRFFSSVLRMHLPANNFRNYSVCLAAITLDSSRPHGLKPTRLLSPWGLSRQESWSGLPCTPPGDLPNPRTVPRSPALQADSLPFEPPGKLRNYSSLTWFHCFQIPCYSA